MDLKKGAIGRFRGLGLAAAGGLLLGVAPLAQAKEPNSSEIRSDEGKGLFEVSHGEGGMTGNAGGAGYSGLGRWLDHSTRWVPSRDWSRVDPPLTKDANDEAMEWLISGGAGRIVGARA